MLFAAGRSVFTHFIAWKQQLALYIKFYHANKVWLNCKIPRKWSCSAARSYRIMTSEQALGMKVAYRLKGLAFFILSAIYGACICSFSTALHRIKNQRKQKNIILLCLCLVLKSHTQGINLTCDPGALLFRTLPPTFALSCSPVRKMSVWSQVIVNRKTEGDLISGSALLENYHM